ncbi:hypothetical protein [Longitalea luteola]|uniref:hypothetical protein n=1 Tax=Longitalea luteola TaxID=2812563 RepID=UPI001A97A90F|nr:hypothetical protein [Longitalea luteola]
MQQAGTHQLMKAFYSGFQSNVFSIGQWTVSVIVTSIHHKVERYNTDKHKASSKAFFLYGHG